MSTRRSARVLLALALVALSAPSAWAQEELAAHLTLLRQTPWNTPKEPLLELEVRATNDGTVPLDDLTFGLTLWSAVRSRGAYGDSLVADPVPASALFAVPVEAEGGIEPGATASFPLRLDLTEAGVETSSSLIYPLKIELRSGLTTVAVLRTPAIFLARNPRTPLNLAFSLVLAHPIAFGADGTFRSTSLETALAEGGSVAGSVAALIEVAEGAVPVDLIVSPLLLLQLERMARGYTVLEGDSIRTVPAGEERAAAAARALERLREVAGAPSTELSALPFAVTPIPSLFRSGLSRDVTTQLERGREVVTRLLQRAPDPTVLRPPGSSMDEQGLERLHSRGVAVLLMDARTVSLPEQPLGFAPPAAVALGVGQRTLTAVIADQGVEDRLTVATVADDPRLAAQAALGELAAIWLEQPSIERAVAIRVPELLPGGVYAPLLNRLAKAPFLRPLSVTDLVATFPPPEPATSLTPTRVRTFDPDYVALLRQARREIGVYASMLVKESPLPGRLETTLLLAEAGQFLESPGLGRRMIGAVHRTITDEWGKLAIEAADMITLTSSAGQIPLRVTNEMGYPVKATVELVSPHLSIEGGPIRQLRLGEASETLVFDVRLRTTGRFPVSVLLRAPAGRAIHDATIVVRSTAYNRVALYVTIGAFVVLLLIWVRRFVRRPKS